MLPLCHVAGLNSVCQTVLIILQIEKQILIQELGTVEAISVASLNTKAKNNVVSN